MGLFDYIGIQHLISDHLNPRFQRKIDVIATENLKPKIKASIERDALHAF
jgi:predicted nucleotidyltransferase